MKNKNLPAILTREFFNSPVISFDKIWDDMLNSAFPEFGGTSLCQAFSNSSYPKVNILDKDDKIVIEAAIPGLNKDDIKIDIEDDILTISAEKKQTDEDKSKNYLKRELHYSSFRRSWRLGENLIKDDITAIFKEGMLTLEILKIKQSQQKKKTIKIK